MFTGFSGALFWLVLAVILFVIEGATVQLVCVWFACGAIVSMLSAFFGAALPIQLALFFVTSIAALIIGRKFLQNKLISEKTATNADAVIGKRGVVLQEIDNLNETGRVFTNGLDWAARSANNLNIGVGQKVLVKEIDGVKLIVETIQE